MQIYGKKVWKVLLRFLLQCVTFLGRKRGRRRLLLLQICIIDETVKEALPVV